MSITGIHSIFILTIIATERFRAVNRPLETLKSSSIKRTFTLISVSWALAIFISLPPLFGIF